MHDWSLNRESQQVDDPSSSSSFSRAARVEFEVDNGRDITMVNVRHDAMKMQQTSNLKEVFMFRRQMENNIWEIIVAYFIQKNEKFKACERIRN